MFHEVWELSVLNRKRDLQGYSRALAMVPFLFPTSVPLQLCLYLAPLTKYYYHLFL